MHSRCSHLQDLRHSICTKTDSFTLSSMSVNRQNTHTYTHSFISITDPLFYISGKIGTVHSPLDGWTARNSPLVKKILITFFIALFLIIFLFLYFCRMVYFLFNFILIMTPNL